jgi:carboxymethylenebutenolidase
LEEVMAVLAHEGSKTIMFDTVGIPLGAATVDGYLARPDVVGSIPCVVVLHGREGSAAFERALCRTLARHGFAAIAPDLFRGESPSEGALDDGRALTDVGEVVEFLDSPSTPWASGDDVVVIGYDTGARLALAYAARSSRPGAVVSISGLLANTSVEGFAASDDVARVNCPILGLYGLDDPEVALAEIDQAQQASGTGTWIVYEGAGHGFMDDASDQFDDGANADATQRILALVGSTFS